VAIHHGKARALLSLTHPAFLLRDPRQKGEAWKDLQMVMKYLGIVPPQKSCRINLQFKKNNTWSSRAKRGAVVVPAP